MQPIRNAAKAVLLRKDRLLVTENRDRDGIFYLLPGGGQESRETLVRECREEIGIAVEVGDLLFVREYIARHHEFARLEPDVHQIEFMFACRAVIGDDPQNGALPDHWQTGVTFVELDRLAGVRFYPAALKAPLIDWARGIRGVPCYLGDVN